jgi:Caspase domain
MRKFALSIGIQNYAQEVSLSNALQDADRMHNELEECDFESVLVEDPDRITMLRALHALAQKVRANPGCITLIYYAGHGAVTRSHKHVLMGRDWKFEGSEDLTVDLHGCILEDYLPQLGDAQAIVVLMDACRTNVRQRSAGTPAEWGSRSTWFQSEGSYRSKLMVSYACSYGGVAADGDVGTHGLYTSYLIKVPTLSFEFVCILSIYIYIYIYQQRVMTIFHVCCYAQQHLFNRDEPQHLWHAVQSANEDVIEQTEDLQQPETLVKRGRLFEFFLVPSISAQSAPVAPASHIPVTAGIEVCKTESVSFSHHAALAC